MKRWTLMAGLALLMFPGFGQSGGDNIWDFLNVPVSARSTSLGGQQISIYDEDLNFVYNNPSLLNPSMSNQLSLSYVDYMADIGYAYVSYARSFEKIGNFGVGLHHIDYGKFTEADEYGQILGTFKSVYDYSFNVYYSRPLIDSILYVGGTIKAIGSKYEYWNSFGMALDAAITFRSRNQLFASSLVIRNFGTQFDTYYTGADREALPFQIQLGISQKLEHAPFRISVLGQFLEHPDLLYQTEQDIEESIDPLTGEPREVKWYTNVGENIIRHLVFGLELFPDKNFQVRLGYNYKRRTELGIPDKMGFSGLSWGFGLKIYKFYVDYGRASYHLAGVTNHFTVRVNLNEFARKF
ncbi:MAG: type IX secretion system protein PorQ [Bacteroidales bacterium]|nr:type IX secretion system protein PorQ [Bacteroidales bacterium]